MHDCSELLRESIRCAYEVSQLLRPTILDDFGLVTALNWLCDRFSERTRIEVEYASTFQGRLATETETHLFRIAQEAHQRCTAFRRIAACYENGPAQRLRLSVRPRQRKRPSRRGVDTQGRIRPDRHAGSCPQLEWNADDQHSAGQGDLH